MKAAWAQSLRFRLLAATVAGLSVALLLAGVALGSLFRAHVLKQFESNLTQQLDQLTARLDFDATGQPLIDARTLSDPRWQKPYSGLYWQIDEMTDGGRGRTGVLRSRSLWDARLDLSADALGDGAIHVHETPGPQHSRLLLLERTVQASADDQVGNKHTPQRWRLIVAADLKDTHQAVTEFNQVLALSLATLLILLTLAAWVQVSMGLKPLRALQHSLQAVRDARAPRLQGQFPSEVRPLVDDFNAVLDRNQEVVTRARTQAGNLAHALKTPLSVLDQAATRPNTPADADLTRLVREQLAVARRHIDWHLARARLAATQRLPGQRTEVASTLAGLVRVMGKVHADKGLQIQMAPAESALCFAGEEQDLQEMLGNLLDNACKWARSRVSVQATPIPGSHPALLSIHIEDDGPGIQADHLQAVMARGVRLDESVPGTGLGLAIVKELADLYGGQLVLAPTPTGGLGATLTLPATG